jgi:hypothetical protein
LTLPSELKSAERYGGAMSTQQQSGSAVASNAHTEWPDVASATLVSAIVVLLIGFLLLIRTPFVLLSISVIALASAAIIAFAARCASFCMSLKR